VSTSVSCTLPYLSNHHQIRMAPSPLVLCRLVPQGRDYLLVVVLCCRVSLLLITTLIFSRRLCVLRNLANIIYPGTFDSGCHWPSREQKDALLREVQKTDPGYTSAKLVTWFSNRRKSLHEPRKEQKGGSEDALNTLLDPTTALARESRRPMRFLSTSILIVTDCTF